MTVTNFSANLNKKYVRGNNSQESLPRFVPYLWWYDRSRSANKVMVQTVLVKARAYCLSSYMETSSIDMSMKHRYIIQNYSWRSTVNGPLMGIYSSVLSLDVFHGIGHQFWCRLSSNESGRMHCIISCIYI